MDFRTFQERVTMPDKVTLTIDLTLEEHERVEDLAHRHGMSPADYLHVLISDAIAGTADYDFDTREGILRGLRESWHQAETGNVRPISELWETLGDDE
jgi:predicted DNA-binding protein